GLVNVVQQYLKKGAQVYIEGQLSTNKYTDNNGQEKYSTQIVLQGYNSTLKMLGGGSQGGSMSDQSSSSSLPSDEPIPSSGLDDEVPF
ncbi:MAG: single-stranded DNA-binding protein, partial [Proteobacteria bacterium]|nr:single-stranded DNA-binding protein [Pseudomonadota bacterium]